MPPGLKSTRLLPADGKKFHAHADIRLLALATPNGTSLGPDMDLAKRYAGQDYWELVSYPEHTFSVKFRAGTNSLGLKDSSIVSARVRPKPGQITPMIMITVGYPAVELTWHDVPAPTN